MPTTPVSGTLPASLAVPAKRTKRGRVSTGFDADDICCACNAQRNERNAHNRIAASIAFCVVMIPPPAGVFKRDGPNSHSADDEKPYLDGTPSTSSNSEAP